jgi:Ca-activated chloride channel family protein
MMFMWPQALWLLTIVPALAALYVWILRRRKRAVVRYANLTMVKAAMGNSPAWRRHVPPVLMLIALTILIVAVARPAAVITLASSRATVILAMDVSGSMRANDVEPSRIAASQAAAKKFIADQPPDVQIGIVAFASIALLVQQPTIEREPLYAAIDNFELRRGTAVGSGILTSLKTIFPQQDFGPDAGGDPLLDSLGPTVRNGAVDKTLPLGEAANQPKHEPAKPGSYDSAIIILLTDGATTAGPDPLFAGHIAADWGVRVFTVGFGSPDGAIVDFGGRTMRAQLDAPTLQSIATITDGEYFEAKSANDLTRVYDSLSTQLIGEKKLTEIAFAFAGVGALLAMVAAGLSLLWFGRLA